jgi:hypothetical protein
MDLECEGNTINRNVGDYLLVGAEQHPRRLESFSVSFEQRNISELNLTL